MNWKRLLGLTCVVVLLLSAVPVVAEEPIKIGWIGSLTGDQAVLGVNESSMIKMLVEETNAAGGILGRQVELFTYDTKGDANEAINATRRIIAQDKVCAILGPNASGQCIAIASVLEQMKVPDISTVATNPKVTLNYDEATGQFTTVKPYNFRVCFTDPYQGAIAAGFAFDELTATKAAILYDVSDDYSSGLTQYFEEIFVSKGGEIVEREAFKSEDVEFKAQLTNILAADADVLFLPCFYKQAALIAKQARELGIEATLLGGDGWPSDQLFVMAKEALQGAYFVNHLDVNDPAFAELKTRFEAKFNIPLDLNGFMAHDAYLTLVAAIEKAGSDDSQAITDALTEITVQGVTGTIQLSKDDHNPVGKEGSITKIAGEGYEFVMKYGLGQ